jgi:uncharacterized protein
MKQYYNCHTHIFNYDCIPNDFLNHQVGIEFLGRLADKLIRQDWFASTLSGVLGLFGDTPAGRLAEFVKMGKLSTQEDVLDKLIEFYPNDYKFILLTMDFDYIGAKPPLINIHTQASLVQDIKRKYKYQNRIFPFLGLDPRSHSSGAEMLDFVKRYLEVNDGSQFAGLKIYPCHGFYPFDLKFIETYDYAQKNEIPIMYHCYKDGGSFYAGNHLEPRTFGRNSMGNSPECLDFFDKLNLDRRFFNQRMQKKTNVFQNPVCYYDVLERFPKLKICLAHFGGMNEINNNSKEDIYTKSWHLIIRDLMDRYSNVFTDVSYIFAETKDDKNGILKNALLDNSINNRIMFGSDFYMVSRKGEEDEKVNEFLNYIDNPSLWDKLASENVERFLFRKQEILT